ncbi:MAG: flagellar protein [Firmicutes bacterium]|nr:flagellar protein [Bacillota bacterium]
MGLNLKNCPRCGKLFAKKGDSDLCPICADGEEEDFQKVKEFLWDNPNATIEVVHEKTGVSRERIIHFIREDRLIAEGLDVELLIECERCGELISHGRFCEKCQQELVSGFRTGKKTKRKKEPDQNDTENTRMYLFDRINRKNK